PSASIGFPVRAKDTADNTRDAPNDVAAMSATKPASAISPTPVAARATAPAAAAQVAAPRPRQYLTVLTTAWLVAFAAVATARPVARAAESTPCPMSAAACPTAWTAVLPADSTA